MNAIVCAAVRNPKTGDIVKGYRHFDSHMNHIIKFNKWSHTDFVEQGFIDMYGEYQSREDALKIVLDNGQKFFPVRNGSTTELYSEGLY